MTVTAATEQLQPVQPNEKCDRDCPANAQVAVLTPKGGRLTFCGHCFDAQPRLTESLYIVALDSRRSL